MHKQTLVILLLASFPTVQGLGQLLTSQKAAPVIPQTEKYAAFFAMIEQIGPSLNPVGKSAVALTPPTQALPYGLSASDIATILPIIQASRSSLTARDQKMLSDRSSSLLNPTEMAKYQLDRQTMLNNTIASVQKALPAKVWKQLDDTLNKSLILPTKINRGHSGLASTHPQPSTTTGVSPIFPPQSSSAPSPSSLVPTGVSPQ
jgi:hypothetical protein